MWKTMLKTIPLNWSTECFRTDCGYNLLKEIIFKKNIKKKKQNATTPIYNTWPGPRTWTPKQGGTTGNSTKGKEQQETQRGENPTGKWKNAAFTNVKEESHFYKF